METSITEDQKKQYKRFVEDAADKALAEAVLDKDGLQRVIENGVALQAAIVAKLRELSARPEFDGEKVKSSCGYLSGYTPKSITEQTNRLRELFPELRDATVAALPADRQVPPNAEGWFAIPRWDKIAPTYNEAVEKVLALVKKTRNGKFYNYREGNLGPQYLRQHERTVAMLKKLSDQQKEHDILVVPCQFGFRHRGCSVRRAREVFTDNEFGLGVFAVGIMLLTHPDRLNNCDDLWIDCAGDECSSGVDGQFARAPFFHRRTGEVGFDTRWFVSAYGRYGSASGFYPPAR